MLSTFCLCCVDGSYQQPSAITYMCVSVVLPIFRLDGVCARESSQMDGGEVVWLIDSICESFKLPFFFSSSCWCGMHSTAAHTPTSHVHPRTVCAVGITMLHGLLGAELMFYLAREAYNVTHLDQKQCQHFFLLLQFGCCLARPSCSGEIPSTICWHSVWRNFVVLRHFPMLITACYSLQLKCTAPSHTHTRTRFTTTTFGWRHHALHATKPTSIYIHSVINDVNISCYVLFIILAYFLHCLRLILCVCFCVSYLHV